MKYYFVLILIFATTIQALSQKSGLEFSFNNAFFNARNTPFEIACGENEICDIKTRVIPEVEFKFNADYTIQFRENHMFLLGAGLNIWAYEEQNDISPQSPPPSREEDFEQDASILFQLNIGYRIYLLSLSKFKLFFQGKVIGGLGNVFDQEFRHLGLQPSLGIARHINENHALFFAVNYTKYFSRKAEGVVLPNPESVGFIFGGSKRF